MLKRVWMICAVAGLVMMSHGLTQATTIDFESLADSESVTTQFPGLTFSNTTAITAGFTLNEFELPPRSGVNVVFDDGGPITIAFDTPVMEVGGYFTYLVPLTLTAFDVANNAVAMDASAFSSNLALSGDVGSSPNELLGVMNLVNNIAYVTIEGDSLGGSFVLDDLAITAVPEPSTLILLVSGLIGLVGWRGVRRFNLGNHYES